MTETMKDGWRFALIGLLVVQSFGCGTVSVFDARKRGELSEAVISTWSKPSSFLAAAEIERYGPPDAIAPDGLGWKQRGPWMSILVWDANKLYIEKTGSAANLEQTVAYRVPESKRADLQSFNRGVRVSGEGDWVSSRSTDESLNILALNLADEIVRGRRDPGPAREFYDKTVAQAAAGKSSPYTQRLLFSPQP